MGFIATHAYARRWACGELGGGGAGGCGGLKNLWKATGSGVAEDTLEEEFDNEHNFFFFFDYFDAALKGANGLEIFGVNVVFP